MSAIRPGEQNPLADALSRFPEETTEEPVQNYHARSLFFSPKLDIVKLQQKDSVCIPIIEIFEKFGTSKSLYKNFVLYLEKR